MLDDFKEYIKLTRTKLENLNLKNGISIDDIMVEVTGIAVYNWVERDCGTPNLTSEQLKSAINRVVGRGYSKN
tara:strand:+ start:506 stop:724 length:219 start_codon:yes stop_codon:yes gene_type:complete